MEWRRRSVEGMAMNPDFWKNKKVLITGHTGFKGSWLSLCLQQLRAKVFGYALSPPTKPNLFELVDVEKGMVSLHADVRDFDTLLSALKEYQPEVVIHMAAQSLVRRSYQQPVETYETNVMGMVYLLEAIRQVKSVRVVVNVTSDKCYENKEWLWGYRETEPLGGYDPYSNSKACSELVTSAYRRSFFTSGTSAEEAPAAIASARAGNVVGGGDWAEDRLIPDCVRAWLKNEKIKIRYPHAIRPWQHVLEPLSGYMLLAQKLYENGQACAEAWNFGPDDNGARPVLEVVQELASLWGSQAQWQIDDGQYAHEAGYLKLDCSKTRAKLGWTPRWDLTTTLEKTAQWYRVYREQPQQLRKTTLQQINDYMKE